MKSIIKGMGVLALGGLVFWNQPVYRKYTIDGKGHIKDLRIVFLTDLHNTSYGKQQETLVKMIKKASPDLILFGGDIADEKSCPKPVETLLQELEGLFPMYYITGNHEYWMDDPVAVHQMFRDYGVKVLIDERVHINVGGDSMTILGLDDPDHIMKHSDRTSIRNSLKASYDEGDMKGYKLLLAHRPEHIESYLAYEFDLVLSGHAHGGQVRIPGLMNGLYAPNQGFLPKYAGGHYKVGHTDFIVSRGLSFRKKLPRIMNPPEVVVLRITSQNE